MKKISLTSTDCLHKNFKVYSPTKKDFNPADLDDVLNRDDVVKTLYAFFKKMIEVSDATLVKNVDFLVKSTGMNYQDIRWIGQTQKRFDDSKFQVNYSN